VLVAVVVALVGILLLTSQVDGLRRGRAELASLRERGVRVPAHARLTVRCSEGRGLSCDTTAVWLEFDSAPGRPVSVAEKKIDGSLYVPSGRREAGDRVATTVVRDPADLETAQSAGALNQSVLDLAVHHWPALTIGLVLLGGGITAAVGGWPRRTEGLSRATRPE
jgi:hypothetical protein